MGYKLYLTGHNHEVDLDISFNSKDEAFRVKEMFENSWNLKKLNYEIEVRSLSLS